jgi:hypothetical protein
VSIQRPGKIFDEGGEEAFARLVGSTFQDGAKRGSFVEPAQGNGYVVYIGHLRRASTTKNTKITK